MRKQRGTSREQESEGGRKRRRVRVPGFLRRKNDGAEPKASIVPYGRMTTKVGTIGVVLLSVSLLFTQLSFFPINIEGSPIYFHTLLYFAPFVAAALFVRPRNYAIITVAMGLILCLHANLMPLDYYEAGFQALPIALGFNCGGALIIWLTTKGALSFRESRHMQGATPVRRALPILLAVFVAAWVITFLWYTIMMHCSYFGPMPISEILVPMLLGDVCDKSNWACFLFNAITWSLVAVLTDEILRRRVARSQAEPLKKKFKEWLLVVVAAAFLVTNTVGYYAETVRCLEESQANLVSQVNYLMGQVRLHEARLDTLRSSERELMRSKVASVVNLLEGNPIYLQNPQALVDLRDDVGLMAITVCDKNGLIAMDTDGRGIGTFSFADYEQTKQYMELLKDKDFVFEEPRHAVRENGAQTDEVRIYAGASFNAKDGFVQIAIDATAYSTALANASMEHLVDSYSFSDKGEVVIAKGNTIVSSNVAGLRGTSLSKYVYNLDEQIEGDREYWYTGEVNQSQSLEDLGIVYSVGETWNDYVVFVRDTAEDIFAPRTLAILWDATLYAVLLTAVYALTSTLIEFLVVRGFKRTNDGLARITVGDLDTRIEERATEEFVSLSDGINTTVDSLKDLIAQTERSMERDLNTAKTIQESALPRTFPPFPEIDAFDLYASMNAAKEVGGDFYDFFLVDNDTLGFLIADVSGKGIPGALFMMAAKTAIQNYMSTGMQLSEAIQTANHHLCKGNDAGMFVTVWAATLNWKTGELTYVNAGHNFPLLRHGNDGTWEWLNKKCGLFLGTFEMAKYKQMTLMLEPGDELLLYTDGVNEAFSADDEEYGNDRLEAFLAGHTNLRPQALVDALRADVAAWAEGAEQSDDITMLALEYGVAPELRGSMTVTAEIGELERVTQMIHAELAGRLCPLSAQAKLDVALEELFLNICSYAYADQDEPGTIEINYVYMANPRAITIELKDQGIPFNPLTQKEATRPITLDDAAENSLGIILARRSVDDISYVRSEGHNIVAFTKRW